MNKLRVGLLCKTRGNFVLQARFAGADRVPDRTHEELDHHEHALKEAGHSVVRISWGPDFVRDLAAASVDLVFNVSSLVEAAILEELDIPYVGSDPFAIAVATDKSLAKRLWQHAGLPTSPFRVVSRVRDCEAFLSEPPFDFPLFVKPLGGRGSAGIDETSIVFSYEQLGKAVATRLNAIRQPVIIERFLRGREITLGVLGRGLAARMLPPLEIRYRKGDPTLTFEKKELDDDSFLCPAPLTDGERAMVQDLAVRAYTALGMRDFGRVDTILTESGPFLLEANTFAGLMCTPREKPHSYIGFMVRAEGRDSKDLFEELIRLALSRVRSVAEQGGASSAQ